MMMNCCHIDIIADINECQGNNRLCHINATCSNVAGSYKCSCKSGFTGDGFTCTGTYELIIIQSIRSSRDYLIVKSKD